MTRRRFTRRVMPVVYPDGTVLGFYVYAGNGWVGPFLALDSGWAA